MKRLVISGLPCPEAAWRLFLGDTEGQRIIPIFEVFENCPSPDVRQMAKYIGDQILQEKPDSIVCHDMGVPMTLLSLLRLKRKGYALSPKVTLFNGAFRKFSVLKAPHLLRIQWKSMKKITKEVEFRQGCVDERLSKYVSHIRSMYRLVILFSLAEAVGARIQLEKMMGLHHSPSLKSPIQLIASPNDPYIPYESIVQLKKDFKIKKFYEIEYGHFPYSINRNTVVPLIEKFENC